MNDERRISFYRYRSRWKGIMLLAGGRSFALPFFAFGDVGRLAE